VSNKDVHVENQGNIFLDEVAVLLPNPFNNKSLNNSNSQLNTFPLLNFTEYDRISMIYFHKTNYKEERKFM
jgi:hypothetical protein